MTRLVSFLGKSRKFYQVLFKSLHFITLLSNYNSIFSSSLLFSFLSMLSLLPFQNFFSQRITNLQNKLDFKFSYLSLSLASNQVLFKALSVPLFDASVIYTALFGAYHLGKRIQGIRPDDNRINVAQAIIAGACSGIAIFGFLAPMDLAKGRLAICKSIKKTSPLSVLRLTRRVTKVHGLGVIYQGNMTKIMRQVLSGATYFGCYEYISRELHSVYGNQNFIRFVAGGTAGLASWLTSYPPSLIKAYRHFDECTKNNYFQNRIMLRGFGAFSSATKAILIEAVVYLLFPNANRSRY